MTESMNIEERLMENMQAVAEGLLLPLPVTTLNYEYGMEIAYHRPDPEMRNITEALLVSIFNGAPMAPTPEEVVADPPSPYQQLYFQYVQMGMPHATAQRSATTEIKRMVARNLGIVDPAVERRRQIRHGSGSQPRQLDMKTRLQQAVTEYLKKKWEAKYPGPFRGLINMQYESSSQVEFHSPVLTSMEQIEFYYGVVKHAADTMGLTRESSAISSAGGHLHVNNHGDEGWDGKFLLWLFYDTAARPYLTWGWCDPEDKAGAQCLFNSLRKLRSEDPWSFHTSKEFAMQAATPAGCNTETLGMRFFEAPRNWDEQRLHVEFVEAWLDWAENRWNGGAAPGRLPMLDGGIVQGYEVEPTVGEMANWISEMGLDWTKYQPILEKNIRARFEYGEEYLT